MSPALQVEDALVAGAARAARKASEHLLSLQHRDGYWWGDLTADSTLESDWLMLLLWLHPPQGGVWNPPDRERIDRAARSIRQRQNPDGGFPIFPKGASDISASVKAYFALKLAGTSPSDSCMIRLRERILALGGMQAANSYVKINLSLFGLFPHEQTPCVAPEIVLLPGDFLYQMSSWTRAIVVPLSVVQSAAANKPRPVPAGFTLQEILRADLPISAQPSGSFFSWRHWFMVADRILKFYEKRRPGRLREKALKAAEAWMLERFELSDGLGAIYPSMQYAIMALDVLGYGPDSRERIEAQRQFDNLLVDDGGRFYFQPCLSPVWDTAIAAVALAEAAAPVTDKLKRTGDWLLSKEVRRKGDWSVKRPETEPSGWYFEFANEFYPDIDDTAMVLMALARSGASDDGLLRASAERAVNWLLAMQSKDGGWAAFDVDNNWHLLSEVPFADHNAMLDPTCPDITGRVLEALCEWGVKQDAAPVRRALAYLRKTQETDGCWYGRWGVNYVYGTFLALRGMRAAGVDEREAEVLRAGEWLRSVQNADGGWGESCESYARGAFVPAESTASQTAWAVMGLIAGGDTTSQSVHRGIEFLVSHQREDGGWDEELATGTGFPQVFYLTYQLYRNSFPTLALAEFLKTKSSHRGDNG
jgi:squalene-hopene/tetraprenyl-beta-curcumene cyclase